MVGNLVIGLSTSGPDIVVVHHEIQGVIARSHHLQ